MAGCGGGSGAPAPPRAANSGAVSASPLPGPGIPGGCVSSALLPLLPAGPGQGSSGTVVSSFAGSKVQRWLKEHRNGRWGRRSDGTFCFVWVGVLGSRGRDSREDVEVLLEPPYVPERKSPWPSNQPARGAGRADAARGLPEPMPGVRGTSRRICLGKAWGRSWCEGRPWSRGSDGQSRRTAGGGLWHPWTSTSPIFMKFYATATVIWSHLCQMPFSPCRAYNSRSKVLWKSQKIRRRNCVILWLTGAERDDEAGAGRLEDDLRS